MLPSMFLRSNYFNSPMILLCNNLDFSLIVIRYCEVMAEAKVDPYNSSICTNGIELIYFVFASFS